MKIIYRCEYCDFESSDANETSQHEATSHVHEGGYYLVDIAMGSDDDFGTLGNILDDYGNGLFCKIPAKTKDESVNIAIALLTY